MWTIVRKGILMWYDLGSKQLDHTCLLFTGNESCFLSPDFIPLCFRLSRAVAQPAG